ERRLEHALDAITPLLGLAQSSAPGRGGLFSRLLDRQSRLPGSSRWTCELCDDPGCEHALKSAPRPPPGGPA
ncbi:MAG TPA: hypothetical protein VK195_10535, partial [Burkholderiaceae bacterium]|nr:hypothetical protein [Burkholderiaceae bacterium]